MRAYFFGNMYLSSIQQGIQAAHVTAEMFRQYTCGDISAALYEWATDHKTMILLNAGYSEELYKLNGLFDDSQNPYAWAGFNESQAALDGAFTSIGIVLPERIYETAAVCRAERIAAAFIGGHPDADKLGLPQDLSDWEVELIETMSQYGLAR